jgi:hypothetical protein
MINRVTPPDPLTVLLRNALRLATDRDLADWVRRLDGSKEAATGQADPAAEAPRKAVPLAN